jgi:hypothetical protein
MLKRILKKYPFFLLLLPVFILTHIEREYHGQIDYILVYDEIIFLLAIPPVVYLFSWLVTRKHRKAGILSLAILLVYYFFGETKDTLKQSWPGTIWQSYTFLLIVFFLLLIAVAVLLIKNKWQFEKTYLFVNTVLILFVVFDLSTVLWDSVNKRTAAQKQFDWRTDSTKPDIYFFIFDSYTSSQFLQEKFGYANSAIDTDLTKKGFKIIPFSQSNYNLTPFSLGSTFHLDYLPGVDTMQEYYLKYYLPGVKKVYENPLFPTLHQLGYDIYNHSIFDVSGFPSSIPQFDMWGLNSIYQQHNLWKKMETDIGWQFPGWLRINRRTLYDYAADRDRHDSIALQHIFETVRKPSARPKFVYGHLFIPHSPYTFDSSGNKIQPIGTMSLEEDMKAYTLQVAFVNTIISRLTGVIQSVLKRPLVIIVQGDHGYRFFDTSKRQWEFPNFNAFYFSNGDYRLLHDSISNVNTFRVVANTFFKQQYPLLQGNRYFLQYK